MHSELCQTSIMEFFCINVKYTAIWHGLNAFELVDVSYYKEKKCDYVWPGYLSVLNFL